MFMLPFTFLASQSRTIQFVGMFSKLSLVTPKNRKRSSVRETLVCVTDGCETSEVAGVLCRDVMRETGEI